jgi:alpha-beta hydrolase superfamily lysophospholipase
MQVTSVSPFTEVQTKPPSEFGADPQPAQACHQVQTEHTTRSWDGAEIFYRAWHPGYARDKAVILFHGGHEHSGRFQELVEQLDLADMSVFAWDARGHGRSPGPRGAARHFHDLVRDADTFVRHISETYEIPLNNMVLLGHSVGSVIISTWLHDYAPTVRGAVLGSPAFHVKLYAPLALPALKLWQRVKPDAFVNSYVKPSMLTHDHAEAEARRQDPLISPAIAVRVLTSLFDTAKRVIAGAPSIRTPVLILSAGSDHVVHRHAQQRFFKRLGTVDKEMVTYPSFYHEIFHESQRQQPIARAKAFIERVMQVNGPVATSMVDIGDQHNFERLSRPLPSTDPKAVLYAICRGYLKTVGCLSNGIRLGWSSGFDSGRMLDYVYANQAQGITPLGRLIDRAYLNATGWSGIRVRGQHLRDKLYRVVRRLRLRGEPVHIVDVASGPGRYLLETLQTLGDSQVDDNKVTATCRDRDERGLQQGRRLAQQAGIASIEYEPGDAFDTASLASLRRAPNIVVVSGLYELFDDNALISRSLRGIHDVMQDEAYLIYTNQPHHPQQELIARTLINRDRQPWVMRLRSQQEMNRLVREAGFEPQEMAMDDAGIFSVTVAKKRTSGNQ